MIDLNDYDNNSSDASKQEKVLNRKNPNYNSEEEMISQSKNSNNNNNEESSDSDYNDETSNDNNIINKGGNWKKPKEDTETGWNAFDEEDIFGKTEENINDKINELLFCVQGLGKFIDDEKTIYEKDEYCEPSWRDIHRFLRGEDNENPICKYALLNWNVCESDIIPLLLTYENNDKISQLCLVILVDWTENWGELVEKREKWSEMLFKWNKTIITSNVIELISRTWNDASEKWNESALLKAGMKKEDDEIKTQRVQQGLASTDTNKDNTILSVNVDTSLEKHAIMKHKISEMELKSQRTIEWILVLFKQILSLYNTTDLDEAASWYGTLLTKWSENKILDAILYYTSLFNENSQFKSFSKQLSSTLLEIIFCITRIFTPKSIIDNAIPLESSTHSNVIINKPLTHLQKLVQQEQIENEQRSWDRSTRPNNFGTRIKITRSIDNSSFIVTNLNQLMNNPKQFIAEKTNTFKEQRHKGKARNKTIFKNKKIPSSIVNDWVKVINDTKLKTFFSASAQISQISFNSTLLSIRKFLNLYLDNCFNAIVDFYYIQLDREDELEKYDIYNLISVISFFMDWNRWEEYTKMYTSKGAGGSGDKGQVNNSLYNIEKISSCLTADMINYAYNSLYLNIVLNKKEERKHHLIPPLVNYIKNWVYIAFDTYKYQKSNNHFNITINVVIQDSLLTKDFTKILKELFLIYNAAYTPVDFWFDTIEISDIYFTSWEWFSKKRKWKIKKKKIIKKGIDDDEDKLAEKYAREYINKSGDEDNISSSEDEKSQYWERDLDVNSESKCLVDYDIVDKIISLFKSNKNSIVNSFDLTKILIDLKNSERKILKFITKLLERIAVKSNCMWIFYQMEYLIVFNTLWNNSYFKTESDYAGMKALIRNIIHGYFEAFKNNKMLPIESWFQFNGISWVENAWSNYESGTGNSNTKYYDRFENERDENEDEDKVFVPEEGEEYYKPPELGEIRKKKKKKKSKKRKNSGSVVIEKSENEAKEGDELGDEEELKNNIPLYKDLLNEGEKDPVRDEKKKEYKKKHKKKKHKFLDEYIEDIINNKDNDEDDNGNNEEDEMNELLDAQPRGDKDKDRKKKKRLSKKKLNDGDGFFDEEMNLDE